MTDTGEPVVPDYGGACIARIVPALTGHADRSWLPVAARDASQVVLLVLDGLGARQLEQRHELAPMLASMDGITITSVAPTTTSTALTSIVAGTTPGVHGVVGYRIHIGHGEVLNVLRWQTGAGDATVRVPPLSFQPTDAFQGHPVPVVTRAEFHRTGFTRVLLGDSEIVGYHAPSSIAVEVGRLLEAGEPLVYAYYDGVDRIAHVHGFGPQYDAELRTADRLVADIADVLPPGAALVVTADHGQVDVGGRVIALPNRVLDDVALLSGEGRFRWLHARAGCTASLRGSVQHFEDEGLAWVRTQDEAIAAGWFGPDVSETARSRMGDVVLAARAPVAFADPAEAGLHLICRHGSLTEDEVVVPLLATTGR